MIYKWEITIPELSGEEKRRIYVYLPRAYDRHPEARFPVLYMLDGQNVFFDHDAAFGTSLGMYDYMNKTKTPLIIVGIANSETMRMSEYSPFAHENGGRGHVSALGRTTMHWLLGTLKPLIDSQLRTLPDREHTLIAGSSMGALISLYAALNFNDYFSRAGVLSPSLWVHPHKVMRMIRYADIAPDTCIYLDYGSDEIGNHPENPDVLFDASNALLRKGVNLTFRIVPGGTHSEASWKERIPVMMKCLGF